MADQSKLSEQFFQKIFEIQKARQERPLTEKEMKQIATDLGMDEEDWKAIQGSFEAHLQRGEGFLDYQNWGDAIQEFEQAIVLNPLNPRLLFNLAIAYQAKGDVDRNQDDIDTAINYAKKCLDIEPQHDGAIQMVSELKQQYAYKSKKQQELAKWTPTSWVTVVGGMIVVAGVLFLFIPNYSNQEEKSKSYQVYEDRDRQKENNTQDNNSENTATETNKADAEQAKAYFETGNKKDDANNSEAAIADFDKAIELDPNFADAYNNRGSVKYRLKDYQGALADFTKAISLNPSYTTAFFNSGLAKYAMQDFTGAKIDYDEAIRLNPGYADAYLNRGNARYGIDDKEGACEDWKKAGELGNKGAYENIKQYCM